MGILFVSIAIVCTYGINRLYSVNEVYGEAARVGFPLTITAQKLVILLSEYRRNEVNHALNDDMDSKRRTGNRMRDLQEAIEESLVDYSRYAQSPMRAAQAREMERMWTDYAHTSTSVRQLSIMQNNRDAVLLLNTRSSDQYDTLASLLDKVVASNAQFSEQALRGGGELYDKARIQLLWLMLCILLLETGIAVYLVRSVVRTLGTDPDRLGAIAREVAQGNLTADTTEVASGVLADILRMVASLRHHDNMLQALTSNIPGAVLRSHYDDLLTLTYTSDGFSELVGYTRDEVNALFDNHFSAMIASEDRAPCMQTRRNHLQASDTYEMEYRLVHKDGHDVWVLDRGRVVPDEHGQGIRYSVLIDISELKRAQSKLLMQEERLRTVLSVSNDMVWEADTNKLFRFIKGADTWLQVYGDYPKNYIEALDLALVRIHPEDAGPFCEAFRFENLIEHLRQGISSIRFEHRVVNSRTGVITWFQSIVVPFTDVTGEVERIVVCVTDINDRKIHESKILHSAQRDTLTGLFNKGCTEAEISQILNADPERVAQHALFIIDVDNFKAVNDNLGHLFGDAVLTDIATNLTHVFHSSAVVGRIGGDEFMVLLCDVAEQTDIEAKAQELIKSMRRTLNGENCAYTVSGSVGIAKYPNDGTTYRELYKNADAALYLAKHRGKGQACFFAQTLDGEMIPVPTERAGLTDFTSRAEAASFKDNVMAYIFELLYEARDVNTVVNIALGMIGKHYDVSRAYVLLNSPDNTQCSIAFEWCNTGIASEKENLQNIPYSACGNYFESYTQDGIFHCEDITQLDTTLAELLSGQGIRSMLHLAIYDSGIFRGCVGFDDCVGNRLWTRDEKATLSMLAKILGLFLFKSIMSQQLEEAYTNFANILDAMDAYAYVCDEETYALLYINAKTQAIAPVTELGMPCYTAFFGGRTTPCPLCPRANMGAGDSPCSLVIHNDTLGVWTRATASRIPWSGSRGAVLISCVDITECKSTAIGDGPPSHTVVPSKGLLAIHESA